MISKLRGGSSRGFTRSEGVILLALIAALVLFTAAYLRTISRRERLLRSARSIQSILFSARENGVRRNQQVVVWFDLAGRRIVAWADVVPDFVRQGSEPTLAEYPLPPDLFFRYAPGGEAVNGPSAVCFDGYLGDPSLIDRVAFRGDGTLIAPEGPGCQAPRMPHRLSPSVSVGSIDCNPGRRCRGIYISDSPVAGSTPENELRVGVDDPGQPRTVTILKWLPAPLGGNAGEIDFVPPPWKWMDR